VFLKNHGVYLINTVDPAIVCVCVCGGVFIRLSRFYISTFHGSRLFLEGGGCRFKAIIVALILGFNLHTEIEISFQSSFKNSTLLKFLSGSG
jgi:hypothetical protein